MAIEARNRPLPDWFTRVRTRQTVLPRFQRFEAWGHSNVAQLFNTILQGLPIGAVLVLEVGDKEPFISRTLKGAPDTSDDRVNEHLLDGQQRLTALWRGLHNNYDERTYFLFLMEDEESGMPYFVDSIARWQKDDDTERRPFWANNPSEQWKRKMIPLDLCAPDIESQKRFGEWSKQAMEDQDKREAVHYQVQAIRDAFASFNLPFLSLPPQTKKETALDVFIKMNTSAAPLSIYDVVVAQVEASMGQSLHDLVADTREKCPAIAEYYSPESLALYVGALLQSRPPTHATYMLKGFGEQLLADWNVFLKGVPRTVAFLEEERVFDAARLPSDVVMPVLVALWSIAPDSLDAEGRARTILRRYLWRSFFSNRYERSTNSRALADFNELRPLVEGVDAATPIILDDTKNPLPEPQELIMAGWPKKKDRLARATLALALKHGGLDLADGGTVTRGNLAKREYHHLFPHAHLRRHEVPDERIFCALNCALVTWQTNRNISDKEPEHYLAERRDGTDLGEAEVKARLATHIIPYEEMVAGDYEAFLERRAVMMHEEMVKLCQSGAT